MSRASSPHPSGATLTPTPDDETVFILQTTWLQALGDRCGGSLKAKHRATNAMHVAIGHNLVGAYQQLSTPNNSSV